MKKSELILACFAASGGKTLTPVQMQKLLFLIDRRMPLAIGGPLFHFEPYDYGPFDPQVYTELEGLEKTREVEILSEPNLRWKKYRPLAAGIQRGEEVLRSLDPKASAYMKCLAEFVTSLSFAELVGSIYTAYPEMKLNSVFKG